MEEKIFTFKLNKLSHPLRRLIAKETNDSAILAELAKDSDVKTREEVANNRHTSSDTLEKLSKCKELFVRLGVAQNENAPHSALANLAKDKALMIRESVANNPSTPPSVLCSLLDENESYRAACHIFNAVESNPNASKEVLMKIISKLKDGFKY